MTVFVIAAALAGCGSPGVASTAPSLGPAAAAPSATTAGSDGATTDADVFGPACNALPQGADPGSLRDMYPRPVANAMATSPLLTTLTTAVTTANLIDTLNTQKTITIYAPDNDAFITLKSEMGDAAYSTLMADPLRLRSLLLHHVATHRYNAADLVAAGKTTELAGNAVTISGSTEAPIVSDNQGDAATVVCANIPTLNASVFIIDRVLMPNGSSPR